MSQHIGIENDCIPVKHSLSAANTVLVLSFNLLALKTLKPRPLYLHEYVYMLQYDNAIPRHYSWDSRGVLNVLSFRQTEV